MVPITLFWLTLISILSSSSTAPRQHYRNAQEHVKYDQRQEGEFNVRADLENFVILLIPTSPVSTPSSPNPSLGLLDLLAKSIPLKKRDKHVKKDGEHLHQEPNASIESFIESKTAPYHVDIDENNSGEESLQTKKQHAELDGMAARLSRAFVITVPLDEEGHKKREDVVKKDVKKDLKKKYVKEASEEGQNEMKLLGAENEQCGPGLSRDKDGICRVNKV